ncbi:MAG: hypothetical protein DELT_02092 [Desulfovibrio sp.]
MTKRKLPLVIAGLAVLAGVGLFVVKMTYESKIQNSIENFFASLPAPLEAKAGKIDVSFFDKSVTITDITGGYKTENDVVTFSIAKIAAFGINENAAKEGAGVTEIAKKLTVENLLYDSKLMHAKIGSYAYRDISGDFNRIMHECVKAFPIVAAAYTDPEYATSEKKQQQLLGELAPLLQAAETLTVGGGEAKDYTYSIPLADSKALVTIAEFTVGKYSLREMGPMAIKNITCTPEGASAPLVSLEFLGMDGAELPSFAGLFAAIGQGVTSPALLKPYLQGQKFALKNLNAKNLTVRNPENLDEILFSLGNSSFSYAATSVLAPAGGSDAASVGQALSVHDADLHFDGMKIAKILLERGKDLPASVLALMPETFSYSGAVQIKASAKDANNQSYDLDCKKIALKENSLGEFSLSLAINDLNTMALVMGIPGPAALKGFDLSVKDTGASQLFFTATAEDKSEEGATPASLRAEALKGLPAPDALPNDTLRGLNDAMRAFIEKPGNTLRITLAPATPLTVTALQAAALAAPEKLGLSASTTPAE